MDDANTIIKARDAIQSAFDLLEQYFPATDRRNTLLEGLEYLESDHVWRVTIGFEVRQDVSQFDGSAVDYLARLGSDLRTWSHQRREFALRDDDGSFVRLSTP